MNKSKKAEIFKALLPELGWEEISEDMFLGGYFVSGIDLCFRKGEWILELGGGEKLREIIKNHLPVNKITEDELIGGIELGRLPLSYIKRIAEGIRSWMSWCDNLRKGEKDVDQIVLIHPDLDTYTVPWFLKDFKVIVEGQNSVEETRLGVLSTKDWDLGKEELRDAILDATSDNFSIWPDKNPEIEDFDDVLDELEKSYPGAKNIKRIYNTDWD